MAKHYRNPKPSLDIDYVTGWNARFYKGKQNKALKPEPLDPEDDFMIDNDPSEKPIQEATVGDVVDAQDGDWSDHTDVWTEYLKYSDAEEVEKTRLLIVVEREYAQFFANQERTRRNVGLPRGITRDMMMQVGMMCDVDFEIDKRTKRAYFLDEDLNRIVLETYQDMLSLDAVGYNDLSRSDWVEIMVEAYRNQTSEDSRYEVLKQEFMWAYGVQEEYNDNGNPIGPYRDFIFAFNKAYKNLYKEYHPETGQARTALTFSELLTEEIPMELAERDAAKKEKSKKAKAKRAANRVYKRLYSDEAIETCFGDELTEAEKFTLRDEIYIEQYGFSQYDKAYALL